MLKFKTFEWHDIGFDEYEVIEGSPRIYKTPHGDFPSMTSVLSILDDQKALDNWKKRIGEEEANKIVTDAANRGNALHDYNESYLKNELKRSDLKGQARTLFNRVKKYLDEIELVIATEVPLYNSKLKYAGRVDCICMLKSAICITDHKNSRKPININIKWGRQKLYKYMLQCAGYALALYEMKGIVATKGCLIVGNHETSNSDRFVFELEPLHKELEYLVECYHSNIEPKESMYYKL